MNILPSKACFKAISIISLVIPSIFISIWIAVIPSFVPATLKSISPRWSSSPWISVSTVNVSPSFISPIAIPATVDFIGTPAAINASDPPQIVACDEDPLDSVISETSLTVYGNLSWSGITCFNALSAKFPCPSSRLPGALINPASPTEYGGKL